MRSASPVRGRPSSFLRCAQGQAPRPLLPPSLGEEGELAVLTLPQPWGRVFERSEQLLCQPARGRDLVGVAVAAPLGRGLAAAAAESAAHRRDGLLAVQREPDAEHRERNLDAS